MEELYILNSKSVKKLAKSLLVSIGFFVVYVCGFATLVMHFGKDLNDKVFILVCILAFFPLLVFFGFWVLALLHYIKLILPYHNKADVDSLNKLRNIN
jgi:biotin transporter BioY